MFLKGRGYSAYANYEAKVSLGVNSAKGSNDGITYVSFDEHDINKKIVKFSEPSG